MSKIQYIDPVQAAHNIAMTFCQHEVQKLPSTAFDAGSASSCAAAKMIWELYSNIYDSVFESAIVGNESSIEEE